MELRRKKCSLMKERNGIQMKEMFNTKCLPWQTTKLRAYKGVPANQQKKKNTKELSKRNVSLSVFSFHDFFPIRFFLPLKSNIKDEVKSIGVDALRALSRTWLVSTRYAP